MPRQNGPGSRGSIRLVLVGGGLLTALVVGLVGLVGGVKALGHYSWTVERLFRPAPQQPIEFTHATHIQQVMASAGVSEPEACLFCHWNVDKEASAGIPPVQQCMFCHRFVTGEGSDRGAWVAEEIAKVVEAWESGEPIRWVRVHRLPDHVRFAHEPHIRAGITCSTCHGDVGSMARVRQVRFLQMGDCVACHKAHNAPTDCATCHY